MIRAVLLEQLFSAIKYAGNDVELVLCMSAVTTSESFAVSLAASEVPRAASSIRSAATLTDDTSQAVLHPLEVNGH